MLADKLPILSYNLTWHSDSIIPWLLIMHLTNGLRQVVRFDSMINCTWKIPGMLLIYITRVCYLKGTSVTFLCEVINFACILFLLPLTPRNVSVTGVWGYNSITKGATESITTWLHHASGWKVELVQYNYLVVHESSLETFHNYIITKHWVNNLYLLYNHFIRIPFYQLNSLVLVN